MPKFTKRTVLGNIPTSEYYNNKLYCGIYPYNSNYIRQCVLYAICRSGEIAEVPITAYNNISLRSNIEKPIFTRNGYGHAIEWWNDTLWDKTTKQDEVRLGDIIVYGKGWGFNKSTGQYNGHVRIVEEMNDDYFYCSGGNEDGRGTYTFNIKIPRIDGSGNNLTGLVGYIHNPFITKEETTDYKKLYEKEHKKVEDIKKIVG